MLVSGVHELLSTNKYVIRGECSLVIRLYNIQSLRIFMIYPIYYLIIINNYNIIIVECTLAVWCYIHVYIASRS